MTGEAVTAPSAPGLSRLVVHAPGQRAVRPSAAALPRLLALRHLLAGVMRPGREPHLDLQVRDLTGQALRTLVDAGPTVVIALPPGRYHVILLLAGRQHHYTVALAQDTTLDLHPEPPA